MHYISMYIHLLTQGVCVCTLFYNGNFVRPRQLNKGELFDRKMVLH